MLLFHLSFTHNMIALPPSSSLYCRNHFLSVKQNGKMRKIQPDVRTVPRISSTKLHFLNYGVYKLVTYTHTHTNTHKP